MADVVKLCIAEIMDFSSSSSDDEEISIAVKSCDKRTVPKIKKFVDIITQFEDKEFRKHFRISRGTANVIIAEYISSNHYKQHNSWFRGTPAKTAECEVFLFFWFAANKTSLREVSQRFDVSISTAHKIIKKVTRFLVAVAPKYITFPRLPEEKEHTAREFEKISGFPHTLGCIDGTSIPIITPAKKIKCTYTNRHDIPCLTLQGICDYERKFVDVFTGTPGKIHDARVLKLSDICPQLPNICGENYHLLGDGAYPIREWLLTPYKNYGNLRQDERNFNKSFCRTRVLIENTFGVLKSRFRQLLQVHMQSVENISKFIIACCVLHNLCIMNEDTLEDNEIIAFPVPCAYEATDTEIQQRRLGEAKRNLIKIRFA